MKRGEHVQITSLNFLARFSFVSVFNTILGVTTFPVLKTFFFNVSDAALMTISYALCLCVSFGMHGKVTFGVRLTPKKFFEFCFANAGILISSIWLVTTIVEMSQWDVRFVQPIVAVGMQVLLVMFYKKIFGR